MDPDLQGGRDCLLVRLLDASPQVGDRETIQKYWRFPRKLLEASLDCIRKADEDIEVLTKAQVLAPESRENLETEIIRRKRAKDQWKVEFLKGIVFKKIREIEGLQKKGRDLRFEVEEAKVLGRKTEDDAKSRVAFVMDALTRKANDDKLKIEMLQKQLAEKSKRTDSLEWRLREKNLEMARKLGEKDLLMELTRKKTEADKEAHRLECDALRLQIKRREDCIPKKRKKDPVQIIPDEAVWECVRKVVEKAEVSARMKSVENTSLAPGGQKEDCNYSTKLKSNVEPEQGGDIVQIKMDLGKEQVQSNRWRAGVQNEASENLVKQLGNMETACGKQERKKERAKKKSKK